MDEEIYDLAQHISCTTVRFRMCPQLWSEFENPHGLLLDHSQWTEVKFLNDDGSLHAEIETLPSTAGGIYAFVVKSNVLPEISNYLVYIGRAKITDSQNLKKRVKSYLSNYNNERERPKIYKMIKEWGRSLHLKYFQLDDNTMIDELEDNLINSLLPPFNDKRTSTKINRAISAFE